MAKKVSPKPPCRFGQVLVNTRKNLGISQYRLAKLSGISERYLNFLEHGTVEPRVTMVIRLGEALGVAPGDLVNDMVLTVTEQRLEQDGMPSLEPDLHQGVAEEMDDDLNGPGM